jgi:O-acetyl-ADP-ribose deacetylase (regulator of RNase III)
MTPIRYIKGDATNPQARGQKIIAHICNDIGKWGKGFVLAVSNRWPAAREHFLQCRRAGNLSQLGDVQLIAVQRDITVANMIAQHGIKTGSHGPPIRYDAVRECLGKVAVQARQLGASVHMPRIGCGLSGGRWDKIEPIVLDTLSGLAVTVYDFE